METRFLYPKSSYITVTGEVLNQITVNFEDDFDYIDYVKLAGGFTKAADRSSIYVISASGNSVPLNSSSLLSREYVLQPGDTIVVPQNLERLAPQALITIISRVLLT